MHTGFANWIPPGSPGCLLSLAGCLLVPLPLLDGASSANKEGVPDSANSANKVAGQCQLCKSIAYIVQAVSFKSVNSAKGIFQ